MFFAMIASGVLAETGYRGRGSCPPTRRVARDSFRVWVIVVENGGAQIWARAEQSFLKMGDIAFQIPQDTLTDCTEYLSSWLEQALADDLFDRIVLIAPGQIMEEYRKGLAIGVRACIAAEVVKDFSARESADIAGELSRMITF